ncbi:hypothetical protein CBW56_15265 [Denitratisoma oestradiolicum]|nr:hypothetical protein CBW56_15265 [Denitratisoma oestradiolicum]
MMRGAFPLAVLALLVAGCAASLLPTNPVAMEPKEQVPSAAAGLGGVNPVPPAPAAIPAAPLGVSDKIPADEADAPPSVMFPMGSAQLSAESGAVIRTVVEALKAERSRTVLLVGYSGHRGSREISLALAVRRIAVVEKELLRQGAHRGQIRKVARGYLKSVLEQCRGSACDQRLQRVELRLVDKTGRELEQSS